MAEDDAPNFTRVSSSKAPLLKGVDNWVDWNVWFQSTLHLNGFVSEFKARGGDPDTLSRIYGLIGTTVTGNAAKVFSTNGVVGDGYKTWLALKEAFGGSRNLEITHKVKAAITERKKPESSMVDYISDKRQLWQIVEAAFQKENGTKDWEKLWEFVKKVALIVNVDNTDMSDFLIMEFSRTESLGKSMAMDAIESSLINFHESVTTASDSDTTTPSARRRRPTSPSVRRATTAKVARAEAKATPTMVAEALAGTQAASKAMAMVAEVAAKATASGGTSPTRTRPTMVAEAKAKARTAKEAKAKARQRKARAATTRMPMPTLCGTTTAPSRWWRCGSSTILMKIFGGGAKAKFGLRTTPTSAPKLR